MVNVIEIESSEVIIVDVGGISLEEKASLLGLHIF